MTGSVQQNPKQKRSWWQREQRPRTPEELFLEHLELIERAARSAGRRSGFSPEDTDDFASTVKLKLIEDDYAVLRQFRGDSSLSTFLITVVNNLCRDFRNHLWGKHRASAKAKHLGPSARVLERLIVRDGLDLATAIEMAKTRYQVPESREELAVLASQLPSRPPRQFVGEAALEQQPATGTDLAPEHRLEASRHAADAEEIQAVLDEALRALEPQDLLLLKMHLGDGCTLATIARTLRLAARPLYTRKDRCLRQLHDHFVERGLTWEKVQEVLDWREQDLRSILRTKLAEAEESPNADV